MLYYGLYVNRYSSYIVHYNHILKSYIKACIKNEGITIESDLEIENFILK